MGFEEAVRGDLSGVYKPGWWSTLLLLLGRGDLDGGCYRLRIEGTSR
jgi:hypothetical protein